MNLAPKSLALWVILLVAAGRVFAQIDGVIDVRTDPEGIEVWLDDKYIGDSPILDKKVKAGRYTLKLVDPVQKTSTSEEVFVQAGEKTTVEKTIKSRFGSLRVASDPVGAEVRISTPMGLTPLSNDFMNPGKYRVEIQYPGKRFEKSVEEVVIPRGEVVSLNKTLVRKSPLDMKALVRLGLGAGAVASFVWAIVEHGDRMKYQEQASGATGAEKPTLIRKSHDAVAKRDVGIVLGSLCVIGFEIVAFF